MGNTAAACLSNLFLKLIQMKIYLIVFFAIQFEPEYRTSQTCSSSFAKISTISISPPPHLIVLVLKRNIFMSTYCFISAFNRFRLEALYLPEFRNEPHQKWLCKWVVTQTIATQNEWGALRQAKYSRKRDNFSESEFSQKF